MEDKKICKACRDSNAKLVKGMCKHEYERQRYINSKTYKELRRQKTVVNQALSFVSQKASDDSIDFEAYVNILTTTLAKCFLLFAAKPVDDDSVDVAKEIT